MWKSDIALEKYWGTYIGYLDLQQQWNWVWVLHMGSSYTAIVLQREMGTRKFQHWSSTTTVWFINTSKFPLHMNLTYQF